MKAENVKCTFMTMANHSVNEVLIRSLNTSITSLIPVVAMLLFGGETLKDFALAMTIGLITGCYSSIAIATPLYAIWKTREGQVREAFEEVRSGGAAFLPEQAACRQGAVAGAGNVASVEEAPVAAGDAAVASGKPCNFLGRYGFEGRQGAYI